MSSIDTSGSNPSRYQGQAMLEAGIAPAAPGAVFELNFLRPKGLPVSEVARQMGLSAPELQRVIDAVIPVDQRIAEVLGTFTATSPRVWLNMQAAFDNVAAKQRP